MSALTVLRDLFRYNSEFAVGVVLLLIVLVIAGCSFFSPYPPLDVYVVPPDLPPSWEYPMGTTSRGQDVFWQLTFAIRNTLLFGIVVAILSRIISLFVGLLSGYKGGWVDRVLMSFNDTCGIRCRGRCWLSSQPRSAGPTMRGSSGQSP
jgi:peptide/nickel transport system permease protein